MSVIMYRFAVFLVGVAVLVKTDVDLRRCLETAVFNKLCCQFNITEENAAIVAECSATADPGPHSCDFETCFAKKRGFMLSNGTIDKTLLNESIEKDYENNTDIMEVVKEKCLVDNLAIYGPPPMCDIKKLGNCMHIYTVLNCPQWEDSDHCNKVRDKIDECENVFP